jgi:hypothetical protein
LNSLKIKIKNRESNYFDNFILIIIILSSIVIGFETVSHIAERFHYAFFIIEIIILSIFTFEIFFKLYVFYPKPWRYFYDPWNIFDFIIVLVSVLPFLIHMSINTEAIIILRVLRLARVLRVFRFISILKPLQTLVSTLLRSLPSMSYVAILILLLFYVYGVIGVFLFQKTDPSHYSSLSLSVLTLFQTITGEGWPDLLATQIEAGNIIIASIYYVTFIVIGSMIILNLFIGVIVSELDNLKEADAMGKEPIHVENHIVIIGWNTRIYNLIAELSENSRDYKKTYVAFLSPLKKYEMQENMKANCHDHGKLHFLFRTGSPFENSDLKMINISGAKSIIIFGNDSPDTDSYVIKVLLSIENSIKSQTNKPGITLPLKNYHNADIINLISNGTTVPVMTEDITARFIAQCCRQAGLSHVYNEILSFYGHEIHSKSFSELEGMEFYEIINKFMNASIIGIKKDEKVLINPDFQYKIEKDDEIIAISESSESFILDNNSYKTNITDNIKKEKYFHKSEKVLIIGGNHIIYQIISELNSYIDNNSEIDIYADSNYFIFNKELISNSNILSINTFECDTMLREDLEKIEFKKYDYIILLSYKDSLKMEEADSNSLITLMYLRNILDYFKIQKSIVTEMLSNKNEELLSSSKYDDYIISDRIDGLLLAQYSQNPYLKKVYDELFDESGSEIYLKDCSIYIEPGKEYSVYEISEKCIIRGDLFIGYRINALHQNSRLPFGMDINPNKKQKIKFENNDKIIVISLVQYLHD